MMSKSLKFLALFVLCVASTAAKASENIQNKKNVHKPVHKPTSKAKPMSINKRKPVRMSTSKAKPMPMNKHKPTSKAKPMSINKRKPVRMPTSKAKPMSMNKYKPTNKKKPASVTKRTIPPPPGPTPELRNTPTPMPADAMARSMSFINIILASRDNGEIFPKACSSLHGDCWGYLPCCQGLYCDRSYVSPSGRYFCVTLPPKPTSKPAPKPIPKPAPKSCVNNGGYCAGQNYVCCQGLYCNHDSNTCGGCVEELSSCAHNDECCVGTCVPSDYTFQCCNDNGSCEDCTEDDYNNCVAGNSDCMYDGRVTAIPQDATCV